MKKIILGILAVALLFPGQVSSLDNNIYGSYLLSGNAKKISLLAFNFNGEIGKYSFPLNKDKNKKLKKLEWCKKLINLLNSDDKKIYHL